MILKRKISENDMAQVENQLSTLYSPTADPSTIKHAQDWLQNFQKQPEAWETSVNLLRSENDSIKFFGASTLHIKVNRDFDSLEFVDSLLALLFDHIINPCPKFIRTKLITTYICVILKTGSLPEIQNTIHNFKSASSLTLDAVYTILFEFFKLYAEELTNVCLSPIEKARFSQETGTCSPMLVDLITQVMNNPNLAHLKDTALECAISWISSGHSTEILIKFIEIATQTIYSPESSTFEKSCEMIIEILSQPNLRSMETSICNLLLPVLTGGQIRHRFDLAIGESEYDEITIFTKLLVEIGDVTGDFLLNNFMQPQVLEFFKMMLMVTDVPGFFGVDEESSNLTFCYWQNFIDIVQEASISDVITNPAKPNSLANIDEFHSVQNNSTDKERLLGIIESSRELYSKLVQILMKKIEYPSDNENNWNKETNEKFSVYRRECSDVLLSCYDFLRDKMLSYLVSYCIQQSQTINALSKLESGLYAIKSAHESIPSSENTSLPLLFDVDFFGFVNALDDEGKKDGIVNRVKKTSLLMIGSFSEWFKAHPHTLQPAIQLLVVSLKHPELTSASAISLKELCDVARDCLIVHVDELANLIQHLPASMQSYDKERVIEGVCNVIQALDEDQVLGRLVKVLGFLLDSARGLVDSVVNDPRLLDESRPLVMNQITFLKSCCRGVSSSKCTELIDLSEPDDVDQQRKIKKHTNFQESQQQESVNAIWRLVKDILVIYGNDQEMMSALSSFMKTVLRTNTYTPYFSPNPPFLLFELLANSFYEIYPHPVFIDTCTIVVSTFEEGLTGQLTLQVTELFNKITRKSLILITEEANPDLIATYMGLLGNMITCCPDAVMGLDSDLVDGVFNSLLVNALKVKEILALRATFKFLISFIHQKNAQKFGIIIERIAEPLIREILLGISGGISVSLLNYMSEVLFCYTTQFKEVSMGVLVKLLQMNDFPSDKVTTGEKEAFVKVLGGTMHLGRYKSEVKKFSQLVKGYSF